MPPKPWEVLSSRLDRSYRVFHLRTDHARSPRTGESHDFFILESTDWVNVIPLTPDNEVVLIRQYRHGIRDNTLEIPGGLIEPEDTPEQAARRELAEETGYEAGGMTYLGYVHPNPAILNNRCHTFLARDVVRNGDQDQDDKEDIEVLRRPPFGDPAPDPGGPDHPCPGAGGLLSVLYGRGPRPTRAGPERGRQRNPGASQPTTRTTTRTRRFSMAETHGFELIRKQDIPEMNTRAEIYRHVRTGAELLSMMNEDENKVFGIAFRTPPPDSTGVAHILIEHSVLCGSRKYPVKEPFVELLKGSLKTFLNAMTYPDKTCYPVASQNVQDFYNLIDVYLDAVFYPRITPHILQQEGWHFEIERPDAPMIFKGVVFNEMKGAYSSPDSLLAEYSQQSLFPDTPYVSGLGRRPPAHPGPHLRGVSGLSPALLPPLKRPALFLRRRRSGPAAGDRGRLSSGLRPAGGGLRRSPSTALFRARPPDPVL